MTREEAIRELKIRFVGEYDRQREAKDMAIKALEQEPSGDAISRKNTLAEFKRVYFDNDTVIRCAELILGGMPTVTPQPKTGHWIWCVGSHKCSNCEEYTCFSHKELLRYCPNCGAKMVEPQESEDKK